MSERPKRRSYQEFLIRAAEKRIKSVREKKRKREEAEASSNLPPIPEETQSTPTAEETAGEETADEGIANEEARSPQSPIQARSQDEIGIKMVWNDGSQIGGPPPQAQEPELPEEFITFNSKRLKVSTSLVQDTRAAKSVSEACFLPVDRGSIEGKSIEFLADQFCTGFFKINAAYQMSKVYLEAFKDDSRKLQMTLLKSEKEKDKLVEAGKEAEKIKEQLIQAGEEKDQLLEKKNQLLASKEMEFSNYVEKAEKEASAFKASTAYLERRLSEATAALDTANNRIFSTEGKVQKLEERIAQLEEEAPARCIAAVKEYKRSDHFKKDVADRSLAIYFEGFEDCQKKAKDLYPDMDVSRLVSSLGKKEEVLAEFSDEEEEEEIPKDSGVAEKNPDNQS